MKNKKLAFLLVPLVIFVWGMIIWKVSKSDEKPAPSSIHVERTEVSDNVVNNSIKYEIIADYRDPFLGTMPATPKVNYKRAETPKKKHQPVRPKINPPWPDVVYGGSIVNQTSNDKVAILTVNQQERLLTLNQELQGVIVSKIYTDSVLVNYNNEQRTIRKIKSQ